METKEFKIVEIACSFSCTKQIRPYEPIQLFASAKAEVNSDDLDKHYETLQKLVKRQVKHELEQILAKEKNPTLAEQRETYSP